MPHERKSYLLRAVFTVFALTVFVYPFVFPPTDNAYNDSAVSITPKYEEDTRPIPDFAKYEDVVEKKKAFFSYLTPEIRKQNARILEERQFLLSLEEKIQQQVPLTTAEQNRLEKLAETYRIESSDALISKLTSLLRRVDIIPESLVLMQAANESAWGTSRFAQKGYNFFGLWCFKKGCGFVPRSRDDGAEHEVAKFRNLSHAMRTYFLNLNRHNAYKELRTIRVALRERDSRITAEALVHGLKSYSERGEEYIEELLQMIRFNRKYIQV